MSYLFVSFNEMIKKKLRQNIRILIYTIIHTNSYIIYHDILYNFIINMKNIYQINFYLYPFSSFQTLIQNFILYGPLFCSQSIFRRQHYLFRRQSGVRSVRLVSLGELPCFGTRAQQPRLGARKKHPGEIELAKFVFVNDTSGYHIFLS